MVVKIEHEEATGVVGEQRINADDDLAAQMAQDRRELDRPPTAQGTLLARLPFSFFTRSLLSKAPVFPESSGTADSSQRFPTC